MERSIYCKKSIISTPITPCIFTLITGFHYIDQSRLWLKLWSRSTKGFRKDKHDIKRTTLKLIYKRFTNIPTIYTSGKRFTIKLSNFFLITFIPTRQGLEEELEGSLNLSVSNYEGRISFIQKYGFCCVKVIKFSMTNTLILFY